jgi:hypothetical protein
MYLNYIPHTISVITVSIVFIDLKDIKVYIYIYIYIKISISYLT